MKRATLAAVSLIGAAAVAGCSAGPTTAASGVPLPKAVGAQKLAGACPATISLQQDWEPEAEHAGMYQLLGPGTTIDSVHKRISGPLVFEGKDTGVRLEIRSGGASIGYAAVQAQMYVDQSITLGAVSTDRAIGTSVNQPVTAVVAPLVKSPQVLMWDPASHPNWRGVADIGASGATVVVAKDDYFLPLLLAKGLLKPAQVDTSYNGSPARFVTNPVIAQQGFATAEPYVYQHEIRTWNKPVKYQLLSDVGYSIYPEPMSVRTADLDRLSPCLTKLVPIVQRAQIDYLNNPGPVNQLIVDAVTKYNDGWTYSIGVANYAATAMKQLGIIGNDTSGPLGGMDMSRVQSTIDTYLPILSSSGTPARPGLKAADIATDRFIDRSIKLN